MMALHLEKILRAGASGADMTEIDRGGTLTEKVYERLCHGLLLGMWAPGEKISARSICKDLGVSLTPAREAMMRLVNEGALDSALNRTYSATTLTLEQYREIANIRLLLEPMAVEVAALKAGDALFDDLERINEDLARAIGEERFRDALRLDSELHLTIYRASEQPTLTGIIDRLWLRAGPTRNHLPVSYRKTLAGYDNHRVLIDALRARDPAAARAAITRDLTEGSRRIIAFFEEAE